MKFKNSKELESHLYSELSKLEDPLEKVEKMTEIIDNALKAKGVRNLKFNKDDMSFTFDRVH